MGIKFRTINAITCACLSLCGCAVGPDYQRPKVDIPKGFKWKVATPDDAVPRGAWWTVFRDPGLNRLEEQAVIANQNLRAAAGRVDQARAIARVVRADFFPDITLDPTLMRFRTSGNLGLNAGGSSTSESRRDATQDQLPATDGAMEEEVGASPRQASASRASGIGRPSGRTLNNFRVPLDLSYELDVWGRVRRSFEAARGRAEASVADFHTVLLTLTTDVATNWFLLRGLDAEIAVLERTVATRDDAVKLANDRFTGGLVSELDVFQARTLLATARADLVDVRRQRAIIENALAVLTGQYASNFRLAEKELSGTPPSLPAGAPVALLERRPDVAGAERRMAAANAEIGVAKAAFFPTITLTGAAGVESVDIKTLFDAQSRIWSIGPAIFLPVFEGGRNKANLARTKARHAETESDYRQTVLVAVREVEDSLVNIRLRAEQAAALAAAVDAANGSLNLSTERYRTGVVNYIDVIEAQRSALDAERSSVQVRTQQFVATVSLVKALGGGWNAL